MRAHHAVVAALLFACAHAPEVPSAGPTARSASAAARCPAAEQLEAAMQAFGAKDLPRAESLATEAVKAFPEDPHPWFVRGVVRSERGDLDGAVADVERAIAIHDDAEFRFHAAECESRRKRVGAAREHARRCVALDPGNPHAWTFLSTLEMENGDKAAAVRAMTEALRLAPKDPIVTIAAASLASSLGQRTSKGDGPPRAAMDHYTRGEELSGAGKWAEAIGEWEAALREDPSFADCHYNIGLAAAKLGDLDRAEGAYRRALALYKPHERLLRADALNNLADLHVRRGRAGAEDVALAREAISLDRARPSKLDTLGRACDAVGDRACAREAYAALVASREPMRDDVRKNAEERLRVLGEPPQAPTSTPTPSAGAAPAAARPARTADPG